MAKKVYDAVATVGEYKKDGETKKRYLTVGAVFENDKGQLSMKLDALPTVKEWSGWISFFEPKQYDGQPSQRSQEPRRSAAGGPVSDSSDFDDESDIPF